MAISRHIKAARFTAAPDAVRSLGLPAVEERLPSGPESGTGELNPFVAILPQRASLPGVSCGGEKAEVKPARYLVAKGLPTLPRKLVEVWWLEYVDMEEFLPALRAEASRAGEALLPPGQPGRSVRPISGVAAASVPETCNGHNDLGLLLLSVRGGAVPAGSRDGPGYGGSSVHRQLAWLEYDIQFRMELASSADRSWTCGDAWQYISCLPGPSPRGDPFEMSGGATQPERSAPGKGKRPREPDGDKIAGPDKQPTKKPKKAGICRLFNVAPSGCPQRMHIHPPL